MVVTTLSFIMDLTSFNGKIWTRFQSKKNSDFVYHMGFHTFGLPIAKW